MKIRARNASFLKIVYWILLGVLLCLAAVLIGGTIYSFFLKDENTHDFSGEYSESRIFTGIGRLRLPVDGSPSGAATVIISITFPYKPEDLAFSEELAARVSTFRTIAGEYFLSFSAEELRLINEDIIKNEILDRFNSILRLGKIDVLYFNDFFIFD